MFISEPNIVKAIREERKQCIINAKDKAKLHRDARNAIVCPTTGLTPVLLHIIDAFLEPHILAWDPALLKTAPAVWQRPHIQNFFEDNHISWNSGMVVFEAAKHRTTILLTERGDMERRQVTVRQLNKISPSDILQYADNTTYAYCIYCTERAQSENKNQSEVQDDEIWHRHKGYCDMCGSCQDCECNHDEGDGW